MNIDFINPQPASGSQPTGAGADTSQLMPTPQLIIEPQKWPEEVIVEPSRLTWGNWGYEKGDINAAYCASTFPKIKIFVHQGQLFTTCECSRNTASCYPLIPTEEYSGPSEVPYSYQGKTVIHRGQSFTLGPKVKFTARQRTVEEETDLLRRQYAYGCAFALGKTYREVLQTFRAAVDVSQGLMAAIGAELAQEQLPNTPEEMLAQLGKQPEGPNVGDDHDMQTFLPGL